jgi:hypothetical protein
MATDGFHGRSDVPAKGNQGSRGVRVTTTPPSFALKAHSHPYANELLDLFHANGARGVLKADTSSPQGHPEKWTYEDTEHYLRRLPPGPSGLKPWPTYSLEMDQAFDAYGLYNWELFFHLPLTVGMHLSKNQRFAEAQRWFHHIFDPTDASDSVELERFWKFRPFKSDEIETIESLLVNLSSPTTGDLERDRANEEARDLTLRSIQEWIKYPFRPHRVAAFRPDAYRRKTLMAYLDNLIAWGDSLYRQDTGEAIDEAMMLFVLAANILGPRPQVVPKQVQRMPQTYESLRLKLDAFSNALTELETANAFDVGPDAGDVTTPGMTASIRGAAALYFCVPGNQQLLHYWDTVADRLFKIRNSLNIKGVFRRLALFEPPIDPAVLARGVAAGLNIGDVVSGASMPLPLVRYQVLAQKASELCQETRGLGSAVLSAMEKEDGEAMQVLRAKHERAIAELGEVSRYGQLQEATKAREGLQYSFEQAIARYVYYELQLGRKPSEIKEYVSTLEDIDPRQLETFNLRTDDPKPNPRDIVVSNASSLIESGGMSISSREQEELAQRRLFADSQEAQVEIQTLLTMLSIFPTTETNAEPLGAGLTVVLPAFKNLMQNALSLNQIDTGIMATGAEHAARLASYERRQIDWEFQSNTAQADIVQIGKQLRAARIRELVADHELKVHRRQIKHAKEIESFLNESGGSVGKPTNKSLHLWMKSELLALHAQAYDLAVDTARKAERALQHELGDKTLSFIQPQPLTGRAGLVAADKLHMDLRRMELAWLELNQREFELTKHVSLLQLDPEKIVELRATGTCTFDIPEALFDLDTPGHYFRRIKSVALSIPCVIGPYVSISCELSLNKGEVRVSPNAEDGYPQKTNEDDVRFDTYYGQTRAVVTSQSQGDSGLFETNLRDERYLPFEGAGVVSTWTLRLPSSAASGSTNKVPAQFDYQTISDVVLHIRYTARDGGSRLRSEATKSFSKSANALGGRLLSLRHEFPSEWAKLVSATEGRPAQTTIKLQREHFPFWTRANETGGKLNFAFICAKAPPCAEPNSGQ